MMQRLVRFVGWFWLCAVALAQQPPVAASLQLGTAIPWLSDGQEFYERDSKPEQVKVDRMALVDDACARAKQQGKLVLWYVHRIQEKQLGGRQMYRAPVLDLYARQVLFSDPDVAELVTQAFVPLRSVMDQKLSDRFNLRPLAFVEPAVVFLDGDGKVVHFLERIRTFHGAWFAACCVRVLDQFAPERKAEGVAGLRAVGRWREALAVALRRPDMNGEQWLEVARLHRLLREPEPALQCCARAVAAGLKPHLAAAEEGLILFMQGDRLQAQSKLEQAWRGKGPRAAEAGYWHALASLQLGDEIGAWRRFSLVAQGAVADPFVQRARANATLGPDDRPLGAAFTGFESVVALPEHAYQGLPKDTTWRGGQQDVRAMAQGALEFLLAQQRDDGGFTDARYAYWPSSEITPNVWVAITSLALTALYEHRASFPALQPRIDRALARGEDFILDPKRLNRGANEDCYSDAYRLLYLSKRSAGDAGEPKATRMAQMDAIVAAAAARQKASGFWAHEYENAFATGALLQELLVAKAAGASVPAEITDKAAGALLSARTKNGAYVYGGAAKPNQLTGLKDSAGRMPLCEAVLLQLGRGDLDKLRFALENFWLHMENLEGVRRNDFHSDGELGGFFFFHSLFHASETIALLPEEEQAAHREKFLAVLQRIPELDGSFLDSHELGRSYGTAMALLTLANAMGG